MTLVSYDRIEMWISILEGFLVTEIIELGLDFLKLEEMSFVLCEVLKVLNEELQTLARNSYCFTITWDT